MRPRETSQHSLIPPQFSDSTSLGCARSDLNLSKSFRLEIPLFNGTEPNNRIFKTELFFHLQQIQEEFKVPLAGLRMEGTAGAWYQWMYHSGTICSWGDLVIGLRQRFGVSAFTNLKGVLSKLSQSGALRDYIRYFEALLNQVPGLDDELYMSFFVSGLTPELRSAVQLRTPSTLHLAMQIALAYDDHHYEFKTSFSSGQRRGFSKPFTHSEPPPVPTSNKPALPPPNANQTLALPAPNMMKRLSHEELQQKREQGLCYYCNERWNGKHRCKNRLLLSIGEIDESDNEGDEEDIVWKSDRENQTLHAMGDPSIGHALRFTTAISKKEIIFGMPWLEKLGRVTHDYLKGSMEFIWQGREVILTGVQDAQLHTSTEQVNVLHKAVCFAMSQSTNSVEVANLELPGVQDQITNDLWQLLLQFLDVFQVPHELPPFRGLDHAIHLIDKVQPVNVKPYRYAYCQKNEIEQQTTALLTNGFIRHSQSPFSSLVLLVKKQDGSWRMCIDYRALNAITIRDRFPIPTIDELLDELGNASVFTKLDLRAGYHQIRVLPADVEKTAFWTHEGHYEFLVMPFGLTNSPATFQAVMNQLFKPYLRKFIIVFFYDILVFSKSMTDHIAHLRIALMNLQQHKFFVKVSKCKFRASSIDYLGHIVPKQGVQADPKKIAAMVNWPEPRSLKQLRGFLGLTGYYCRFVQGYASLAAPLTDLVKASKEFHWSCAATQAFSRLKVAMTVKDDPNVVTFLTVREGIVYHKNRFLLSPKSSLIPSLIREAHASPVGGHAGITRTFLLKYETTKPAGLLQSLPIPEGIFEDLSMDFIMGLPPSSGSCTILVVVDRLSKFAYFGKLPRSYTSAVVAQLFCDLVVINHGFPCSY
ncbi:uncharacterized protein LOC133290684 [Gastrolobium bilobum]|uniref:uncharacterized protein LOC133290684 n=1 Tax=Gastrolobium bilobum TaxID=150636 RepID=UPI002AB09601|nr:uncharacterized protein LOC133290684 [Gastrolobium bilobum]